jgi:cytoskeletal protein RodZ
MQNKKFKKVKTSKRRFLIPAAVVLVVLIAGGIVWKIHDDHKAKSTVTLSPSAKLEQKVGQQQAEQKGSPNSNATGSSPTATPKGSDSGGSGTVQATSGSVTPSITYPTPNGSESASSVEVDAIIPGVFENGGTCALTLTSSGGAQVKQTSTAMLTGQNTSCRPLQVPSSSVSAGNWTAVVSYSSAAYHGTSAPVSFIIN